MTVITSAPTQEDAIKLAIEKSRGDMERFDVIPTSHGWGTGKNFPEFIVNLLSIGYAVNGVWTSLLIE